MYQRAKGAYERLENSFVLAGVTGKAPVVGPTDDFLLDLVKARLAGALAYENARIWIEGLPNEKAKKISFMLVEMRSYLMDLWATEDLKEATGFSGALGGLSGQLKGAVEKITGIKPEAEGIMTDRRREPGTS